LEKAFAKNLPKATERLDPELSKRNEYEEKLLKSLEDSVREEGAELLDLRLLRENGKMILRLIIDKRGGVGIDDCERVSHKVDPQIDAMGESRHDFLEVSSPGLERPLTELRDYLLHLNEWVDISFYTKRQGSKVLHALLLEADETALKVKTESGEELSLKREELAQVKRSIEIQ